MEKIAGIVLSAVALFTAEAAHAQGTLYVSNLGETSAGSRAVASNAWIAGSFFTGNASGGYVISSIQPLMAGATGSPSNFHVSLYSNVVRVPASNLGSLSGPDPSGGGIFTYSTSGIPLARFTLYFIVVTASNDLAGGAFNWSFATTANYDASDQWAAFGNAYTSSDGLTWTREDHPFQFAVYGTAVPEPESWLLILLGLTGFGFGRWAVLTSRRKPVRVVRALARI